eukprot:12870122-Alexandrium_andersonii.AAC.1
MKQPTPCLLCVELDIGRAMRSTLQDIRWLWRSFKDSAAPGAPGPVLVSGVGSDAGMMHSYSRWSGACSCDALDPALAFQKRGRGGHLPAC